MLLLIVFAALTSKVSGECTRAFLKARGAEYLTAQSSGHPNEFLAHTASNFTYLENNIPLSPSSPNSTLLYPLKIDYNYTIYDTSRCATFTEILSASDTHPYGIHTRIEYAQNDGPATLLESVVTDRGDWLFNASMALKWITQETWAPIPQEKQDTRALLQHVGDLYFDRFNDSTILIPWGLPCSKIEGGLYTSGTFNTTTQNCDQVLPSTIVVPYRRYVVDEEASVVDIFMGFPGLDRTQGKKPMPDSHVIRVEGGKIKYMHTASACVVPGCGEFDPDDALCEAEGRCEGN